MFRSAFLLFLVAGLAIGLWIGFDPHLHKQGEQAAHDSRVAFADLKTNLTQAFNKFTLSLHSGVHLSWSKSTSQPPQAKFSWKQLDATLTRLWDSLKAYFEKLRIRASLSH